MNLMNMHTVSYAEVAQDEPAYTTVSVCPGDTLWSIAQNNYPESTDRRKVVYSIEKANGLRTSTICSGQTLLLPDCAG